MKKMKSTKPVKTWNGHLPHGMEDLTFEETNDIKGAESVWYWISFASGKIGQLFSGA